MDADSNLFIGTLRLNESDREVRDAAKADTRGPATDDTVHRIVSNDDFIHRLKSSTSSGGVAPPGEIGAAGAGSEGANEDEHRDQGKVIEHATSTFSSSSPPPPLKQ